VSDWLLYHLLSLLWARIYAVNKRKENNKIENKVGFFFLVLLKKKKKEKEKKHKISRSMSGTQKLEINNTVV
jgi:hypothetical protein